MSYLRPVRFVYRGDREKAPRYTREARRMVAALIDRSGGALSNRAFNTLADGTTIEVILAGQDVTAVITAEGGKRRARWFEDFVVFTGINAFIGDELIFFPVILKHTPDLAKGWIPYFWRHDAPGYEQAPPPKGTYIDVFPRAINDERGIMLPGYALTHINSDGRAVSWYGQAHHRYFWTAYRRPPYMYWTGVACFGRVLLNTMSYQQQRGVTLPAHYVVGAAIKDDYLYVMLGDHIYNISYNMPTNTPGRRQAWMSPIYPQFDLPFGLVRFPLTTRRDPNTGVLYYKLSDQPHEVLWQGNLPRAMNGWVFDPDVTKVVSYTVPTESRVIYQAGEQQTTPSATHERHEITISPDGASASLSTTTVTTAIAEDGEHVFHLEPTGGGNWQYRLGDLTYKALSWDGGGNWSNRGIAYMDLPNKCFVFNEYTHTVSGNTLHSQRRVILSVAGDEEVLYTDSSTRSVRGSLMAERASILSSLLDTPISGMAMWFMRIHGYILDEVTKDTDGEIIEDRSVYELVYDPLGHVPPALSPGASFGGGYITTADNEDQPGWRTWNVVVGYDGFNDPRPTTAPLPSVYYVATGGLSLPNPFRVCLGLLCLPVPPFNGPTVTVNYITGGDLEVLTGGVINSTDPAISVSILGKPPPGQTVEY